MEIKIDETYHVASCCCPKFAHEVSGKIVSFTFPGQEFHLYHTQKKRGWVENEDLRPKTQKRRPLKISYKYLGKKKRH